MEKLLAKYTKKHYKFNTYNNCKGCVYLNKFIKIRDDLTDIDKYLEYIYNDISHIFEKVEALSENDQEYLYLGYYYNRSYQNFSYFNNYMTEKLYVEDFISSLNEPTYVCGYGKCTTFIKQSFIKDIQIEDIYFVIDYLADKKDIRDNQCIIPINIKTKKVSNNIDYQKYIVIGILQNKHDGDPYIAFFLKDNKAIFLDRDFEDYTHINNIFVYYYLKYIIGFPSELSKIISDLINIK